VPLDVTMCPGGDCPLRQQCYRYRAIPEGRQAWFGVPPFQVTTGTCDSLWEIVPPTEDAIRTRAYYAWVSAGRPEGAAESHWVAARRALEDEHRRALRDVP
jgi:hypothetical protein